MKENYEKKTVPLENIVNRRIAVTRVRFTDSAEADSPENWKQIIGNGPSFRRYGIILYDNTPDEPDEEKKKYSILYGLKKLYAAERLGLEGVNARVIDPESETDMRVAIRFFNADFSSLNAYEKGAFLERTMTDMKMRFDALARRSGYPYATLQALRSAYGIAERTPALRESYRSGRINLTTVLSASRLYDVLPWGLQMKLTRYLERYGRRGCYRIRNAVQFREREVTIPQAVRDVIETDDRIGEKSVPADPKETFIRLLSEDLGAECPPDFAETADDFWEEREKRSLFLSYVKSHDRCRGEYGRLCALLPVQLRMDFPEAVCALSGSIFSYALPASVRSSARGPEDKSEKRLLSRIIEYLRRTGKLTSERQITETALDLFDSFERQAAFSSFFTWSLLLRTIRGKVLFILGLDWNISG